MRPDLASVLLAAAAALTASAPAEAKKRKEPAPVATPAPNAPKLILAISVDQLSADLFARYRRFYVAGLKRLQDGAVFPSGFQSHAATETCPGHSTLLTGAHPSRSGIIANNWFEPDGPRGASLIYCSEDERDPKSSAKDPVVSAWHLKVPTLGDRMKAAFGASRNVAVSSKDRAVIMMGGHQIDAAYWWKGGGFVTLPGRPLAPEAEKANAVAAEAIKAGAPAYAVPAWCAPRDRAIPVGKDDVGTGHFAMEPGKEQAFRVSPRADAAVADLAIKLSDAMKLGKGKVPDVLSVSFSANDYVGHGYGTEGVEMCIQQAELDKTIGRLLDALDAKGIDYAVALSADHGGFDLPERLDQQALPEAERVDADLTPAKLSAAIRSATGIAAAEVLVLNDGANGDYYLSRTLSADDRARATAALVAILKAHPQVEAVFTKAELAATPLPNGSPQDLTLIQRARESFDAQRSGDLVVLLKRAVVPIAVGGRGYVATHGSPWDYDRRVPMLFWRKGLLGFEQPAPVETVDIAPTLAALVGLPMPAAEIDGRCLDLDGGERDTCKQP